MIKLNQIQYGNNTTKPKLHKKEFYKIYSPIAFKLKPLESITIDLKINIIWAEGLFPSELNLYPTLLKFGLSLEDSNWKKVCKHGTKHTNLIETINVTILNKNCKYCFNIKKHNLLLYFLLPYTNKKIVTDSEFNELFC